MRLLPAGVADHDVEAAKLLHRFGHQPLAERLFAQVTRNRDRLAARLGDELDDLAGIRLLGRVVVDSHVRALASIGDRRGPTHPGIPARDQGLASGEPA